MSKNFNLNIHHVTNIEVGPVKEHRTNGEVSANREIIITTDEGAIEITLFSQRVSEDSDDKLLEIRL